MNLCLAKNFNPFLTEVSIQVARRGRESDDRDFTLVRSPPPSPGLVGTGEMLG